MIYHSFQGIYIEQQYTRYGDGWALMNKMKYWVLHNNNDYEMQRTWSAIEISRYYILRLFSVLIFGTDRPDRLTDRQTDRQTNVTVPYSLMRGGGHWTWRALIGAAAVTGKQGFTHFIQSEERKHINWWFLFEDSRNRCHWPGTVICDGLFGGRNGYRGLGGLISLLTGRARKWRQRV